MGDSKPLVVYADNDGQWSRWCQARDRGRCRVGLPGCRGRATEVHHVVSRGHIRTRLALVNGLSVCRSCHNFLEEHPDSNLEICRKVMGEADWDRLIDLLEEHYGQ